MTLQRGGPWKKLLRGGVGGLLSLLLLLVLGGCTRQFFRKWVDRDVDDVLAQKDRFPFWKIENYHVYPDPRARFADTSKPDRPAMPPDDPAAHELGPNPQKPYRKSGVAWLEGTGYLDLLAQWDAENRGLPSTGPVQQTSLQEGKDELPPPKIILDGPVPEKNCPHPYLLRVDQAVELGLINSREFQNFREDLYLTALPVTLQRFAFGPQFFLFGEAFREWTGSKYPGGGPTNQWRLEPTVGFTKLFSTGALLLFSYANRTVIDLSGTQTPNPISVSTMNLDIVQPLLQGAGKAVTLEPLTQAERNLLYEIRTYARFRKQFFQSITGGQDLPGSLGGAGSVGGSALSPGNLPVPGGNPANPQILPGGSGRINLATGQAAPADGFLPVLLNGSFISSQEKNVKSLTKALQLFEAYEEGGNVSSLQVGQVKLQLLSGQSELLRSQKEYRDALDRFKLQLGVPVNVPLELEDGPLRPVTRQLGRFEKVIEQSEEAATELDKYDNPAEAAKIRQRIRTLLLASPLVQDAPQFRATFSGRWESWSKQDDKGLTLKLETMREERRKVLDVKSQWEEKGQPFPQEEQKRLESLERELAVGAMEFALRRYETQPWKEVKDPKTQVVMQGTRFRDLRNEVVLILGEVSNERMRAIRASWEDVDPILVEGCDLLQEELEKAYELATQAAVTNRLDLMNARAQVTDAWRQIAIFANSLLGVFNVAYHMDSTTPPGQAKPLAFDASRTRHQLVLSGDLPLVRMVERNNYRASLIGLQRARRALMAAEDQVVNQVRTDLRQLRILAENYRIQRQAVELAYLQVVSALETFRAPPVPGAGGASDASAAALTNQLLGAYARLPQAQNQLMTTWINYQIARQQLYLDLEMMPLDSRGVWIDELNHPVSQPDPDLGQPRNLQPLNPAALKLLPPVQIQANR